MVVRRYLLVVETSKRSSLTDCPNAWRSISVAASRWLTDTRAICGRLEGLFASMAAFVFSEQISILELILIHHTTPRRRGEIPGSALLIFWTCGQSQTFEDFVVGIFGGAPCA